MQVSRWGNSQTIRLLAGCTVLYSEDRQDGLKMDEQLRVVNPFNATRITLSIRQWTHLLS